MVEKITYEQPLNERVRTFLRLEFLFHQIQHTLQGDTEWDSRATMGTLLDILNVCGRSDLRTELLKELERHAATLTRLERAPGVDQQRLTQILDEIDVLVDRLHALSGQPGQLLRQNEFINSIKQRSATPGGTCDFDLPAYHYWLQRPAYERIGDLERWLTSLDSVRYAVGLILRLIRECAMPTRELAIGGFYQKSLDPETPCQLVRIQIPQDSPYYAEISGGKHRFTVRFMEPVANGRALQTAEDVEFEMTCCVI